MWIKAEVATKWWVDMAWARCDGLVAAGHNRNWIVMMRIRLVAVRQGKGWCGNAMVM